MPYELDNLKELVIGQTYSKALEFLDEFSNPIDIQGSTLYFTLKDSLRNSDANAVLSVSTVVPSGQEPSKGKVNLVIDSDAWSGIEAKQYYWSLVRVVTTDTPQSVYPHSSGKLNLIEPALGTYA